VCRDVTPAELFPASAQLETRVSLGTSIPEVKERPDFSGMCNPAHLPRLDLFVAVLVFVIFGIVAVEIVVLIEIVVVIELVVHVIIELVKRTAIVRDNCHEL
jgi:hypothetical protein